MRKFTGFGKRVSGITSKPPVPTPTKLEMKRPPTTPLEEMAQIFRLITR